MNQNDQNQNLVIQGWDEYQLLDSGEGAKLEKFGNKILIRPDPRALWKRKLPEADWNKADAAFLSEDAENSNWTYSKKKLQDWEMSYKQLRFSIRPTTFKHVGIFPEQCANWDWLMQRPQIKGAKVLNLFGYTGGATLACATAGAHVTHVDASKPSTQWAKDNAVLSKLPKDAVRWILDDALKFVLREQRRGQVYDGIILDPPRFGRGANGEVWKLHKNLPILLEACAKILSPEPRFFLLNAYTADLSSLVLRQLVEDLPFAKLGKIESGEILVTEKSSGRFLPNGIFARFSR